VRHPQIRGIDRLQVRLFIALGNCPKPLIPVAPQALSICGSAAFQSRHGRRFDFLPLADR